MSLGCILGVSAQRKLWFVDGETTPSVLCTTQWPNEDACDNTNLLYGSLRLKILHDSSPRLIYKSGNTAIQRRKARLKPDGVQLGLQPRSSTQWATLPLLEKGDPSEGSSSSGPALRAQRKCFPWARGRLHLALSLLAKGWRKEGSFPKQLVFPCVQGPPGVFVKSRNPFRNQTLKAIQWQGG